MTVKFLEPAKSELDDAYNYYEAQVKGLGTQFLDEILRVVKNIKSYPEAWPNFSSRTRRCIVSKFPYAVVYQIRESMVLIVAITHLHREPEYWKDRL